MNHEKSCGVVVFRNNHSIREYLLILQKKSNVWGFPKGHVDAGESEYETALREVFEETGITTSLVEGFRMSISYKPNPQTHKVVVFFLGSALNDVVTIQPLEIKDYAWLKFDDAIKKLKFKNSRDVLQKAEEFIRDTE